MPINKSPVWAAPAPPPDRHAHRQRDTVLLLALADIMVHTIGALVAFFGTVSAVPVVTNGTKTHPAIEAAAERLLAANRSYPDVGIVNGRVTNSGEWEGTVMVIGSNGDCEDSGLCTGMFIHVRFCCHER